MCVQAYNVNYRIVSYSINKKDWVNIMKEKLMRFMYGRYGVDTFGKFLLWSGVILMLITSIFHFRIFYVIGWAFVIYSYYRMFSRQTYKRAEISPAHFKDPWIFCKTEVYGSAAQDAPHLQVSKLQTEDPCSKGKR